MSTRFKKNVLKPENINKTFFTEWAIDSTAFSVSYRHSFREDEEGVDDFYLLIGTVERGLNRAEIRAEYESQDTLIAGYKRMVKDLRKIGKILSN